jgi:hypothetical protein
MIPCFLEPESISLSIHLLIYETRTSRHTLYMSIKSRIRNEGERIQTDALLFGMGIKIGQR